MKFRFILWCVTICLLLTSCSNVNSIESQDDSVPTLIYYTIGTPDKDLALVNQKLNEILIPNYHFAIEYHKIPFDDYGNQLNTLIGSGKFDIAFTAGKTQGDYLGNAKNGTWLSLDSYLEDQDTTLYNAVDPLLWKGVRVNKQIYGVPTNKELAVPEWFVFSSELVEKYEIPVESCTDFSSLQPYLYLIKEHEPDCTPFLLDSFSHNFFALNGYDYLIGTELPLMFQFSEDHPNVVNILETEEGMETLQTIRRWYVDGLINVDAALRDPNDIDETTHLFCTMSSGGPLSERIWEESFHMPVQAVCVSEPIATTNSAVGGIMAVRARTRYPEECLKFLELVNTDPVIRNLLNYGVEGIHYEKTEDNQVRKLTNTYSGIQYTQGNWFILDTLEGEPLNKWDTFAEFNKNCTASSLLGFSPDLSSLKSEIEAVSEIWMRYFPAIMTGSIDPDEHVPLLIEQLKANGIDTIQAQLQQQIDEWLSIQ